MSSEFEYVKGQLALLHEKLDNSTKQNGEGHEEVWRAIAEQSKVVSKHTDTLYGNGKVGLTTLMNALCEQFRQFKWIFGIGITVVLAIFGKIAFF